MSIRHARFLALMMVASLCLVFVDPVRSTQTSAPEGLDTYVGRVLKEFEVPGLAVAIVKDGKVVLAKGYGVRKLGEPAPADENTLFGIASNTKAFTAGELRAQAGRRHRTDEDDSGVAAHGFQLRLSGSVVHSRGARRAQTVS
ncbi:MAG: serine hydrolase domain-containing protein [Acidobacteriota bacterium]